ncbi:organic cation transporter protein-like [Chrysoperla carnea]|uniref:organic cation transporter protein-like n=1 Tax=Chrysoperla carnea TaxID=189513 RepID=UPI001D07B09F|nr:organic cation transporter protein-like [Chrysoperla carnea]
MDRYKRYRSMKMHQSSVKELPLEDGKQKHQSDDEEDDIISAAIGNFGRWQFKLTFLLSLFNIPCTWHIFAPTFHAAPRNHWCGRPAHLIDVPVTKWINISQPVDECSIYNVNWNNYSSKDFIDGTVSTVGASLVPCTQWEFEGINAETVVSQWELVCDKKQLINIAEMMFLAGVAIGGFVSGVISDRYGRKRTLMGSVTIQTIIGVCIAFCPWFELYLILRACLGFISVSVVFSGFVLTMEIVGGHWRTIAGCSYLFPVPLSYITISGMAYLLRDWRDLQLAISLPGILFMTLYWVLPESPRWLLATGKKMKVLQILQEASLYNGRDLPDNIDKQLEVPTLQTDGHQSAGVADLFRTSQMRRNIFFLFIIWFSVYLVYYGLVLNISNIGGDLYINSVLSGVVEIPSIAVSILFLMRGGRRWPLCLTLAFAGVACLLSVIIPTIADYFDSDVDIQWLKTACAHMGKFSVSSSNAVMPVFTAELFPTVIRNLGVGASNVSAGIALMLVPYLWNLSEMDVRVPMGILGICGIIGGISVLFLPETGNKPLAATVEEQESPVPNSPHKEKKQEETFTLQNPTPNITIIPTSNAMA